jgi:Peptidase C13 family
MTELHRDDSRLASGEPEWDALTAWWRQGLRSTFLLRPRWDHLQATPRTLALLMLVALLASLAVERLLVDGEALFYWQGLFIGWLGTAIIVWVCWMLVPHPLDRGPGQPATAAALFSMFAAQALPLNLVYGLILVPLLRTEFFGLLPVWPAMGLAAVAIVTGWIAAAQAALIWHSGNHRLRSRVGACALLTTSLLLHTAFSPQRHWYPDTTHSSQSDAPEPMRLTQELLEIQPQILQERLRDIGTGRRGVIDMYSITFAPYATEDVFRRESELVSTVMQERFAGAGKTIQLVNHRDTVRHWPWATPLNLKRAIDRMAEVMDRDEDVLFIHLTSHGARDGELAADFWPLHVDAVTPQTLKQWLDEAGIRHRVISVSACYSGSWIEPLADSGSLVMTSADATHTSYGCGRGSELTYFGRAMFDEELRHTESFEKAHAAARITIDRREREAGKSDGYSNPQIRMGNEMRDRLARMNTQLTAQ